MSKFVVGTAIDYAIAVFGYQLFKLLIYVTILGERSIAKLVDSCLIVEHELFTNSNPSLHYKQVNDVHTLQLA